MHVYAKKKKRKRGFDFEKGTRAERSWNSKSTLVFHVRNPTFVVLLVDLTGFVLSKGKESRDMTMCVCGYASTLNGSSGCTRA